MGRSLFGTRQLAARPCYLELLIQCIQKRQIATQIITHDFWKHQFQFDISDTLKGKKSKDDEPKKLEVADDKSAKSASTAKTSTSGTGSKTVTSAKSEDMGERIQQNHEAVTQFCVSSFHRLGQFSLAINTEFTQDYHGNITR